MSAIDISRYQGAVDFNAVKAAEVGVVIAKMGGGDAGVYVDAEWTANRAGIRAADLVLGSYYFNGPGDTPTQAADFQFANIDYRPGDMVVIDVEGSGIAWSPGQVLEWANRMIAHGVPAGSVGVYMSASVVRAQNWSAVAALGTFLWVASYGANTGTPGAAPSIAYWSGWRFWQYTSNGSIPGVPGRVDVSQIAPGFAGGNVTPLPNGLIDMGVLMLHPVLNAAQAGQPWMLTNELTLRYTLFDQHGHDNLVAMGVPEGAPLATGVMDQIDGYRAVVWPAALLPGFNAPGGAIWAPSAADLAAIGAAVPAANVTALSSAIAAVATELATLDTASASYHADLAATLAKGFTITGTVK